MSELDDLDHAIIELARSSDFEAIRRRLHERPELLGDEAERRLTAWMTSVPDPQLRQHLDRLAGLVRGCRRDGVDATIDELSRLDALMNRLSGPRGAGAGRSAGTDPVDAPDRTLDPSAVARRTLQRYSERNHYRPMIDRIAEAGADGWIRTLLGLEQVGADASSHYDRILASRQAAATEALRAYSAASRIDCTRIPITWIRLGSPNALAVRGRDGGAAIGVDVTVISELVIVAFAGLDAMRRDDPGLVLQAAERMARLADATDDEHVELDMLALRAHTQDLRQLFDAIGDIGFRFVLGHELGHLALDHFDVAAATTMQIHAGDSGSDISCFPDHRIEHEADAWAADHLRRFTRDGGSLLHTILADTIPAAYFAAANLVDRFGSAGTEVGETSASTHPPHRDRSAELAPTTASASMIARAPEFAPLLELPGFLYGVADATFG